MGTTPIFEETASSISVPLLLQLPQLLLPSIEAAALPSDVSVRAERIPSGLPSSEHEQLLLALVLIAPVPQAATLDE